MGGYTSESLGTTCCFRVPISIPPLDAPFCEGLIRDQFRRVQRVYRTDDKTPPSTLSGWLVDHKSRWDGMGFAVIVEFVFVVRSEFPLDSSELVVPVELFWVRHGVAELQLSDSAINELLFLSSACFAMRARVTSVLGGHREMWSCWACRALFPSPEAFIEKNHGIAVSWQLSWYEYLYLNIRWRCWSTSSTIYQC